MLDVVCIIEVYVILLVLSIVFVVIIVVYRLRCVREVMMPVRRVFLGIMK